MNKLNLSPIDTSKMDRVGGQLGSNFAGLYQDNDGQRYYVKELESPALARNEWIAAHLYQLVGAPTLIYVPTVDPCQVATLWETLDKQNLNHFSAAERCQVQQWFAVHAWTANWDALGLHGDNQGILRGDVITIDVGGALQFRACGDPKGKAFGDQVSELTSMRTLTDNRFAAELFGPMDEATLRDSLLRVTNLEDDSIVTSVRCCGGSDKLAIKMLARKHDVSRYLKLM
jgi:hypothetical protein